MPIVPTLMTLAKAERRRWMVPERDEGHRATLSFADRKEAEGCLSLDTTTTPIHRNGS